MSYTATRKLESSIEKATVRSVYGDMHAHRDAELMAAHVEHCHSQGFIDDAMAVELSKTWDKDRKYTTAYLETLRKPLATNLKMPSLRVAERLQKKRDRKALQWLEGYEAGRIDAEGNSIAQEAADEAENSSSDDSQLTVLSELETRLEAAVALPIRSRSSSTAVATPPLEAPAPTLQSPLTQAQTPSPMPSSSQKRKRKTGTVPLETDSDTEDYSKYNYYELLAVCRERKIFSSGNAQEVRNRLIHDDINIAEDLPRDFIKHGDKVRKHFKHEAPAALKKRKES